jgi:hypothetical protein
MTRLGDGFQRSRPFRRVFLLKCMQRADDLAAIRRAVRAAELRLGRQQQHRSHVRTVDGIDEVGVAFQAIAHQLQGTQLLGIGRGDGLELVPLACG